MSRPMRLEYVVVAHGKLLSEDMKRGVKQKFLQLRTIHHDGHPCLLLDAESLHGITPRQPWYSCSFLINTPNYEQLKATMLSMGFIEDIALRYHWYILHTPAPPYDWKSGCLLPLGIEPMTPEEYKEYERQFHTQYRPAKRPRKRTQHWKQGIEGILTKVDQTKKK